MNTKKLLLHAAVLATMLTSISCSQEEVAGGQAGDESVVTFTAQLPGSPQSKAIGDGMTATTLSYAVYAQGTTTPLITSEDEVAFTNGQATISLRLASGRSYDLLFWADAYDAPYTVDFSTQTLTIDYDAAKPLSNDESLDAFFGKANVTVKGAVSQNITLKRPFAQLNIGTNDMEEAKTSGINTEDLQSSVKVSGIFSGMNLMTGIPDPNTSTEVIFGLNDIPDESFTADGRTFHYLALNYLLVSGEKGLVNCEFTYTDGTTNGSKTISNVPVQRNYRTNIFGSILTGAVDLGITIDPDFASDHNYEELLLAAQNGGSVTLTEDVTITEALTIANGVTVTIDLNNHDIINNTSIPDASDPRYGNTTVFQVGDGATLNIRGNGNVHAISNKENEDGYRMAVYALGNSVVNIYGGNFYNNQNYNNGNAQLDLIYADQNAVINIYGGTFESACANSSGYWVLNLKDGAKAAINVYGGTFVNFDPSSSLTENPVKNFVATGYSSVKVSDDPTPNGTYRVVEGTGVTSGTDVSEALKSGKELITLAADVTIEPAAFASVKKSTIDLNGQTLTFGKAETLYVPEGGNLTFRNGEIVANDFDATVAIISANEGSSITLDGVTINTTGTGIGPSNCASDVTIEIRNSELNCGAYGFSTNATMPVGSNVKIILADSKFSASEPVFINIPCEATIDNCDLDGTTHGMVLRGGTATVSNSTITLTYTDDDYATIGSYFDDKNWGTGNMLNIAALTVGNKGTGTAYQYPSELHLINTTVESAGQYGSYFPALYSWANQGEGLGVTITYDIATQFKGDLVYGSDNITVNGKAAEITE